MKRLDELKQGASFPGDHRLSTNKPPPWLDKDKFYQSRDVFKRYFFSIFFAHLAGLIFTVYVPLLLPPLLSTGKSSTVLAIFRRYLSTLTHVKSWYEGDIWDPTDSAYKSIVMVREMHNKVADKLNIEKGNHVHFSQYEMALAQYAFIGLLVLYPRSIGIMCSQEDMESIVYFWRGIGYQLGISDDYNICSKNYTETRIICKEILEEVVKPHIINPEKQCVSMSRNIATAMSTFIIFLSWEALAKFWFEIIGIPVNFPMNMYQLFSYRLMKIAFRLLLLGRVFHSAFNALLLTAIKFTLNGKKRLEQNIIRYLGTVQSME